jgi:hypothetical protein
MTTMKFGNRILCGLLAALLLWGLPAPVEAQFSQQGPKLVGTGAIGNAEQGLSVAVSGDGNTGIVGGPQDNSGDGAAWVYTRAAGAWSQQAKLAGTGVLGPFAAQGISVAVSGDGNTAIVGGPDDNHIGSPVNAVGAAWVFTRSGGMWSQQAKLVGTGAVDCGSEGTTQGDSVSLSDDGNTAIIGGLADNCFIGAAWVFTRSAGTWSQQGDKLVGTGAIGSASQGASVSLSHDGNTAIVGGPTDAISDTGIPGAAWVFTRSAGVWSQQAKLVGTGVVGGFAFQGQSVALSGDGNTAIVGGPFDDLVNNFGVGAAWVFTRSGGMWSQQAKLVGTGAVGSDGASQGQSVSISADGNTAIVGGPSDNPDVGTGAAWVFTRSGGVWSQQDGKLVGTGALSGAGQGQSVSLSNDGNTAIVGGPFDSANAGTPSGAAWVYFKFAGAPGKANCFGQSVSALAREFGGLSNAAANLGFASVGALQDAILAFCEE